MKKILIFILLAVTAWQIQEKTVGAERIPNRFARLYPTLITLEKNNTSGAFELSFIAHNHDAASLIRVNAFTIPADPGASEIQCPDEWFETGRQITISYKPLTSNPEPVLLVVHMQDQAGYWRNWNVAFYR